MFKKVRNSLLAILLLVTAASPMMTAAEEQATSADNQVQIQAQAPDERPIPPTIHVAAADHNPKNYRTGAIARESVEVTLQHSGKFTYSINWTKSGKYGEPTHLEELAEHVSSQAETVLTLAGNEEGTPVKYHITAVPDGQDSSYEASFDIVVDLPDKIAESTELKKAAALAATDLIKPLEFTKPSGSNLADVNTQVVIPLDSQATLGGGGDISKVTLDLMGITFTEDNAGAAQVKYTLAWNSSTYKITLTPEEPLTKKMSYKIVIPAGVFKDSSNALNPVYTKSFTTDDDTTPPQIVSSQPANGEIDVPLDSLTVTLKFSEPLYQQDGSKLTSLSGVELQNSAQQIQGSTVVYDSATNSATVTPSNPLALNERYSIIIRPGIVRDKAQNVNSVGAVSFTTESSSVAPLASFNVSKDTPVDPSSNITITFDKNVYVPDGSLLSSSNAYTVASLTTASNATVDCTISYNSATRVLTLDPKQNLAPNSTYNVALAANQLTDKAKRKVEAKSVSFTTTTDSSQPIATISLTGSNSPTSAPIDTTFDIEFNEDVKVDSLNANLITLKLKNPPNTSVPFTTSWVVDKRTIRVDPINDLNINTDYMLSVQSGAVKDLGNNSNITNSLIFKTQAADNRPLTTTPIPANNATNVPLDTEISFTFNKAITPTTGTTVTGTNPNTKFILKRLDTNAYVASTLAYDAATRKISIVPTQTLASNTRYEMTIKANSVLDTSNSNTANTPDTVTTFTTATDNTAPTATFYPTAGMAFPVDNNLKITFNKPVYVNGAALTSANAAIAFSLWDKSGVGPQLWATYNATTRELTIDPVQSLKSYTSYTLSVNSSVRDSSNRAVTPASVSFTTATDSTPPVVQFAPTSGSAGVLLNSNITLRFSEPVTLYSNDYRSYISLRENGQTVSLPFTAAWNANTQTIVIDPTADLLPNKLYFVSVMGGLVRDVSNNPNQSTSSYFYTQGDTIAPTFTTVPASGASNVSCTDNLRVTVSEPFTLYNGAVVTSLNAATILSLQDSQGRVVESTVTYNPNSREITLDPKVILKANQDYRIVINANQIKDLGGNGNAFFVAYFHTINYGTPYLSADITNNQTNVSVSRSFQISFSEKVFLNKNTTITNANVGKVLMFTDEKGKAVPFSASWDSYNYVITLSPKAKLKTSARYSINISAGQVQNAGGIKNAAFYVSFTTVNDGVTPMVVSSPENGDTNVALDEEINLQFSKPVVLANGSKLTDSNVSGLVTLTNSTGQLVSYRAVWDEKHAILSLDPTPMLKKNEAYTLFLPGNTVYDLSNNPVPSYSASFYTIKDASLVKITTKPASGDKDIPTDKPLTLTFGEAVTLKGNVKLNSINLGTIISLYDENMQKLAVNYTWSESSRTAQITPKTSLKIGSTYSLVIQASKVYTKSNKTNAGYIVTFTTTKKATPPTIKSSPKDGEKNVSVRKNIEITFSEKVTLPNGTAISADNVADIVTLADNSGNDVAAKVTWNATLRKITIDPKLNLKVKKTYYVVIPDGAVVNLAGTPNAGVFISFKTADK